MTFPLQKPNTATRTPPGRYRAVVIGVSAGGMNALSTLLPALSKDFPLPILVVQHRLAGSDDYLAQSLNRICAVKVKEAEEKEPLCPGTVYIAPADYHLLVERDLTAALSVDPKENYARPSIDVLFESAAYAWASTLIGIILTGANADGAAGMALIQQKGGLTIIQDPATAEHDVMPRAAAAAVRADQTLTLEKIAPFLHKLINSGSNIPANAAKSDQTA